MRQRFKLRILQQSWLTPRVTFNGLTLDMNYRAAHFSLNGCDSRRLFPASPSVCHLGYFQGDLVTVMGDLRTGSRLVRIIWWRNSPAIAMQAAFFSAMSIVPNGWMAVASSQFR